MDIFDEYDQGDRKPGGKPKKVGLKAAPKKPASKPKRVGVRRKKP